MKNKVPPKVQTTMRFTKKLLMRVDAAARAEGISRTTWLENVCRAFLYSKGKGQTSGAAAAEASMNASDIWE